MMHLFVNAKYADLDCLELEKPAPCPLSLCWDLTDATGKTGV